MVNLKIHSFKVLPCLLVTLAEFIGLLLKIQLPILTDRQGHYSSVGVTWSKNLSSLPGLTFE